MNDQLRSSVLNITSLGERLSPQGYVFVFVFSILAYSFLRVIYLLRFHPLASFPGPKIAAVSNVWYGYYWLSGRYPWAIQRAFDEYGDVVRIAPNEVVFITPEAYTDIYTSTLQGRPAFVKSDMLDMGEKYEGLASERDIDQHRAARKQLAPAFSPRALKEYQPRIHDHTNRLLQKLKEISTTQEGFNIVSWFERITTDLGGAIAVNHDFHNVRDGRNNPILASVLGIGEWTTIRMVLRRFPLISWLSYLLLPPKVALSYVRAHRLSSQLIEDRVKAQDKPRELDYLAQFIRPNEPLPPKDFLVSQAGHLIFDHFESSSVLSAAFYFLTTNETAMHKLQEELRQKFHRLDDMTDDALRELPWLHAIIEETLRLHTNVPYGLPRISPGHTIDGHHVPKGCVVSTCAYATTHSVRYFRHPYSFKPQRWLPISHPDHESIYDMDAKSAFRPFSIGSRNCIGQAMAYVVLRIIIAKLCWTFDWQLANREEVNWDRDLRVYMVWQKPPVKVRLVPYEARGRACAIDEAVLQNDGADDGMTSVA